jgi:hypothetical protein
VFVSLPFAFLPKKHQSFLLLMQTQKYSCRANIFQNILPSDIIRISSIVHWLHLLRKLKNKQKDRHCQKFFLVKDFRCTRLKIQEVRSSKFCQNLWGVILFGQNLKWGSLFCVLLLHFFNTFLLICLGFYVIPPYSLTTPMCWWGMIMRSNFMRSKFNFFRRSNYRSWGWNS